jgi:hypothetical protein
VEALRFRAMVCLFALMQKGTKKDHGGDDLG